MSSIQSTVYVVQRDNNRPLRFTGMRIGHARSTSNRGRQDFSGQTGISQVMQLFVNKRGEYVASSAFFTEWQGQRDRHDAVVTRNREDVVQFFGLGWLAMEVYASADWDIAENLDEGACQTSLTEEQPTVTA